MLLLASVTQNSFEPVELTDKAQQATFEFCEDCPMNLLKAIVVGLVICGSALSYAEDGYDRSIKFNEKFRADQKRIHGTESAEKKADELKVNEERNQS